MDYYLFRKLKIKDKDYYQFYKIEKDFNPPDSFANFQNRDEKDFFYVKEDTIKIPDNYLYLIFEDKDGKFTNVDDIHLLSDLYSAFKEKFKDLQDTTLNITELKPINEIVDLVSEKIKFQRDCIKEIVEQIYYNQRIFSSSLHIDSKVYQKSNILFIGPSGMGKKSIIKELQKNIDLPYANIDVTLEMEDGRVFTPSVEELKLEIAKKIVKNCPGSTNINSGIIYIFEDEDVKESMMKGILSDTFEIEDKFLNEKQFLELSRQLSELYVRVLRHLICDEVIRYEGHIIDFRGFTFVALLNNSLEDIDEIDINNLSVRTNCDKMVFTKPLSLEEKMIILLAKGGKLYFHRQTLNEEGKELLIEKKALKYLIDRCNEINPGMTFLNNAIEHIIKIQQRNDNVYINTSTVKTFCECHLTKLSNDDEIKEEAFDITLKPIYDKLRKKIVGQDKGLKTILYNIIENRRMANRDDLSDYKQYIKNILVRGESGGGKTFIINNIAKALNIPVFIADATAYTEAGYVGGDIDDMLVELYHSANNDLESAEKGILVIDEVDKKAGNDSRNDISRGAVLNGLLKIIEGSKITINVGTKFEPEEISFDTSRLTVICSGAFEDIEKIRDERLKKMNGSSTIGFNKAKEKEKFLFDDEIIDKDYVEYGMRRQFMARIPVIVNLTKNTKDSLKNIMINSSASALKIESERLAERGITLEYTPTFYDRVANEAIKLDIGVRGIDKVLQKVLSDINIQDIESDEVEKIILDGSVIDNKESVQLIPRTKKTKVLKKGTIK